MDNRTFLETLLLFVATLELNLKVVDIEISRKEEKEPGLIWTGQQQRCGTVT